MSEGGTFVGDKAGGMPEGGVFQPRIVEELHEERIRVEHVPTGIRGSQTIDLQEGQRGPVNEAEVVGSITKEHHGLEDEIPFMVRGGLLGVDKEISMRGPEGCLEGRGEVFVEDAPFPRIGKLKHGGV